MLSVALCTFSIVKWACCACYCQDAFCWEHAMHTCTFELTLALSKRDDLLALDLTQVAFACMVPCPTQQLYMCRCGAM